MACSSFTSLPALALALALIRACSDQVAEPDAPTSDQVAPTSSPAVEPNPAPTKQPASKGSAADLQAIAKSGNAFAFDVYSQLRSKPGNFAFSPSSISTAFAMTYGGARGETAEQMRKTLHFDLPDEALHAAYGGQIAAWNDPSRSAYELRVVNRIFAKKTGSIEQAFLDLTGGVYGAPIEQVDFHGAPNPSRQHINTWVEEQTEHKIKDLLPEGSVDELTRLVLTNAVYFKGKWKAEFDPDRTLDGAFYRLSDPSVTVPMMHLSADLRYAKVGGVEILEMPYVGDELAMDILLPSARDGLPAMEQQMSGESVERWLGVLAPMKVAVSLPRFKVDTPEPIRLKSTLKALGMVLPFSDDADFSAMSSEGLFIDEAYHKAFVEVNEEGTEAAAATAVVMNLRSAATVVQPFVADHPFVFVIRDLRTGAMLFVGRVLDPGE